MGTGSSTAKSSPERVSNAERNARISSESKARTPEQKRAAWVHFQRELPRSKSEEDKERRIDLFKKFDVNGRRSLKLREVYEGCRKHLFLQDFTPRLADIVERAFDKAKAVSNAEEGVGDPNTVEFLEFRLLLCYMYDYFKLTELFDEMDTSGNMMLTVEDLERGIPVLQSFEFTVRDAPSAFRAMDTNASGLVSFDEFAAWAMSPENQTGALGSPGLASPQTPSTATSETKSRSTVWKRIRKEIPMEHTEEDKARRLELFRTFDSENEGALTLAETYRGCNKVLHLAEFTSALKDVVKRAYKTARSLITETRDPEDRKVVGPLEFRLMMCYIYFYFSLTVLSDKFEASDTAAMDIAEFREASPKIATWGLPLEDPDETFNYFDPDGTGRIAFDDFAQWGASKKVEINGDPDDFE